MNRLYIIRFRLSNNYIVSTWWAWNEEEAVEKIQKNPEWTFTLAEDNDAHKIWDAH